jgi:hypothetical protein
MAFIDPFNNNYGVGTVLAPQPTQQQSATSPQDVNALLAQLYNGTPNFQQEAQAQADSVFGPQYQALNQQTAQTKSNAKASDAKLAAMYKALTGDINAQSAPIKATTSAQKKGVQTAYDTGRKEIAGAYGGAANELTSLLGKLGLQDAGNDPRVLANNLSQGAFLQNLLSTNNASGQNLAGAEGQNALNFNTAQANIADQQGTNSRADLQTGLQTALANYSNQGLKLASDRAALVNSTQTGLQNTYYTNQQHQADQLYQQQKDQTDNALKLQIAEIGQQPTQAQQYAQMAPMDKVYSQAAQLFGVQGDAASRAVNTAMSVGADPSQFPNAISFAQAVVNANRQAAANDPSQALPEDALQSLAVSLWAEAKPTNNNYASNYLNQQ